MYIRFSALLPVAALVAVAAAAPTELVARDTTSQCNTGPIQCCNNTYTSTNTSITSLLGLLGVVLPNVLGLIGLGCSPVGTGTGSVCVQQPVCCTGNTFNGLVNIGCSPITIVL